MSHFVIEGQAKMGGNIPVFGSKNAAMPLLAATLLTREEVHFTNIPPILDVKHFLDILSGLGAEVAQEGHEVTVRCNEIDARKNKNELIGLLRGSVLLLGGLLGREKKVRLPLPGGDIIGARPIDVHLDGLRQLGAQVTTEDMEVVIDGSAMKAGRVILQEFSVTGTENIMMAAVLLPGTTTIEIAAAEPHVVALANFLNAMGAKITGAGTHQIIIEGVSELHGASFENIPDMLEAGFFILLGAATQSTLTVQHVPMNDMLLFFKTLDDIGIQYDVVMEDEAKQLAAVTTKPSTMRAFSVQTLPFPGVATDLQAPFSVIATQVTGSTLIHDPMYEGRFKYISELQKMGANVVVCDPHRVIITGPTPLVGRRIPSLDIRAGATLLMAGLTASGTTIIDKAEIIDRGYANLMERLTAIGAHINREEDGINTNHSN